MEISIIAGIIIIGVIIQHFLKNKEENEDRMDTESNSEESNQPNTLNLMLRTLHNLGC